MSNLSPPTKTNPDEHDFAFYVRTIGRGKRSRRSFTREEAQHSFRLILDGKATDTQIGAYLMLLRVKEETPDELAGFVEACRAWVEEHRPPLPSVDLDWPSYAGKKKHHPWYLLAALLLAENSIRIFMHGGAAHTPGRLYTDQALKQLGLPVAQSINDAETALAQHSFCYLGLDILCPPLDKLLTLRYELGLRSPVNTLTRCMNPSKAPTSLQSVFHPAYIQLQQGAAEILGEKQLAIFKGEGGEIEMRPDADNKVFYLRNKHTEETLWPSAMRRQEPPGNPNVAALTALWRDEESNKDRREKENSNAEQYEKEQRYGKEAVVRTTALALLSIGQAQDQQSAIALAEQYWLSRNKQRI